jgi:hypothetical protein
MKKNRLYAIASLATLCCVGLASRATAQDLITNGGFEAGGGSFAGWTETDEAGGTGSWFIQTGTGSPLNGFTVQAPPEGSFAAMTDQGGPGSHALIQSFVVPTNVTSAILTYDLFLNNQAVDYYTPNDLDYTDTPNQQGRVDILTGTAGAFSVAPADVLDNVYQTQSGDPLVSGYTTETVDVTALLQGQAGNTLQLRFAEADNQLFIDMGIDDVSLDVTTNASISTPEPSGLAFLVGIGITGGLAAIRRRRSHS